MRKAILMIAMLLIPVSGIHAQEYSDNDPSLSVTLETNRVFITKDQQDYTVVTGLVENINSLTTITNIKIQVKFYDEFSPQPIEVVEGGTTLDVIAPNAISPYMIRSATANPEITQASVLLLGFDSSVPKQKELLVFSRDVTRGESLHLTGSLKNGAAPISDTKVHLAMYDAFDPPRIIGVQTVDLGIVKPNDKVNFEVTEEIDPRTTGVLMMAESDIFYSDAVDVEIPFQKILEKRVTITSLSIQDRYGERITELKAGEPVNIVGKAEIQFIGEVIEETPYTYYIQIKESGKSPTIQHLEGYDGRFIGTQGESQIIDWIPQEPGLYFLETFVWDRDNIPLAQQGPVILFTVK